MDLNSRDGTERLRAGRRNFLRAAGGALAALASAPSGHTAATTSPAAFGGVFPIAFSPFTPDNKLDLDGLAAQVAFCNRGGVHGLIWPQLASAWSTLSDRERLDGTGAILSAGKGRGTTLVIGVQASDMAATERYAKHAEKLGADALISLPPPGVTDEPTLLDFYTRVGRMTALPLFAQSTGSMSVELLTRMYQTIPTFRHVKDEAGNPLARVAEIRNRTEGQLRVFSGFGVQTMITEMQLGFAGHCPYTSLADLYSSAWNSWHAGKQREAFDMFGRIQAVSSMMPVNTFDILIARGVFKPGTRNRQAPPVPGAAPVPTRGPVSPQLSIEEVRKTLQTFLAPWLKA